MKRLPTLLFCLFLVPLSAQELTREEALFFAEALEMKGLLNELGHQELAQRINAKNFITGLAGRKRPIAHRGRRLPEKADMLQFLGTTYYREHRYRTALPEAQAIARTLFGEPAPVRLTEDQQAELLSTLREQLTDHPGLAIERALGVEPLVPRLLTPSFLRRAVAAAQPAPRELKESVYRSQVPANRSVLGKDQASLIADLRELGLIEEADLQDIQLVDSRGNAYADHRLLQQLSQRVYKREHATETVAASHAYLDQLHELDLLDEAAYASLRENETFLQDDARFPAIRQLSSVLLLDTYPKGKPLGYPEALASMEAQLPTLDPVFTGIQLEHTLTPNGSPAERRYRNGPDLTIKLTCRGKTTSNTYRLSRIPSGREQLFHLQPDFLQVLNDFLEAEGVKKRLYTVREKTPRASHPSGNHAILFLTPEVAAVVRSEALDEFFSGPGR